MKDKITVIHHSADFDGLFCREIARKFLGDSAEYIGWDFGDAPLAVPPEGTIYILDLPVDRVFGYNFATPAAVTDVHHVFEDVFRRVIWIDHHKSSIQTHNPTIPGYRIDGVAACRLAWQWFQCAREMAGGQLPCQDGLPDLLQFKDRRVVEPYAVQLAGEYDVWDKSNPEADVFQFALRSQELTGDDWEELLGVNMPNVPRLAVALMRSGYLLQSYQRQQDASVMGRSFMVEFEGLKFLALNTARCNSLTFAAKDKVETGHDALMGFSFDGKQWKVSLYHARHRTDLDLSAIARRYGGGGHEGACGFTWFGKPPFLDL